MYKEASIVCAYVCLRKGDRRMGDLTDVHCRFYMGKESECIRKCKVMVEFVRVFKR